MTTCPVPTAPVTIILVSWNTRDLLRGALVSIRAHAGLPVQVVVVDNASSDDSVAMVRTEFPEATIIANSDNRGFGQANNQGIAAGTEPFILLLNSDAELTPGALPALLAEMERHPEAGAVGAQLVFPDGRLQESFSCFPTLWRYAIELGGLSSYFRAVSHLRETHRRVGGVSEVDWVVGAALLIRREALATVQGTKGFDPQYHMYSEEMDLCRRIRDAHWSIRHAPAAVVIHHLGQSTRQRAMDQPRLLWESRLLYYRKHRPAQEARRLALLIRLAYRLRALAWTLRARTLSGEAREPWLARAAAANALLRDLR